jgi:phosphoribosylformimino-5-aminoimidazole carboxamide ribotide isomerase
MRVIPVIDLKSGAAVHAVRGERERYRPLRSGLVAGSDPVEVARAVREALGLGELYVAPWPTPGRLASPPPCTAARSDRAS